MLFDQTNFFHHFTKPSPNYTTDEIKYILEYKNRIMKTREIKFRVYCTFRKQMITVGVDSNASFNYDGTISTHGVLGENPLMQFIDREDSEGVDMYEADIIRNNGIEYVIEWYDRRSAFMAKSYSDGAYYFMDSDELSGGLIIGNIYKNPELIKQITPHF